MPDSTISTSRRALNTTGTTPSTATTAATRTRLSNPAYSAADVAVANEVRARLDAGAYDRNPVLKAKVINLLASVDGTAGGRLPRIPDRNTVSRVMGELRNIRDAGTTGGASSVGTTPPAGSEQPFGVEPVGNTAPPERIREVKVAWDYNDVNPNIAGFRLYHEGVKVGEIRSATARAMNCDVSLSEGAHSFTLTAFDVNGLESDPSAPAILNNVFPPE
ncbi:MAG: hypothetical protein ABIJ09_00065 [Pseudomonadota bacterium]